jgi:RHS repeat-associated protein
LILRDRDTDGNGTLDERLYATMDYFNGTAVLNASGTILERYAYAAFGERRIMSADFSLRATSNYAWEFGFQGQFRDAETGWLNYGYRFYVPLLGRWLSRDPIGEFGPDEDEKDLEDGEFEIDKTMNLYAFGPNDGVNGFDSDGRYWTVIRELLKRLGPKLLPKPKPPTPRPPAPKPPAPKPRPKPNFGNCTAAEHAVLNAAVGAACKGPQFSCNKDKHPNLDCPEIQARIGRATACAAARAAINQKCFNGGDPNHRAEQANATKAAATCAARYAAECFCGPPNPPT